MLKVLLDGGANVKLGNKNGCTAAGAPSQLLGHAECLRNLLAAGAEKEAKEERGNTPLHLAAQEGRAEVVKVLLSAGCDMDARDNVQDTPLAHAAKHCHVPVVQQLLAHGANPNAAEDLGNTQLMTAIITKQALCIAELVPVSELSITDTRGRTTFHIWVKPRHRRLWSALRLMRLQPCLHRATLARLHPQLHHQVQSTAPPRPLSGGPPRCPHGAGPPAP